MEECQVVTAARPLRGEGIYNIVDDEPVAVADWLPVYAAALGAPAPRRIPTWLARVVAGPYGTYMMTAMPGASNARAEASLGWKPSRPSWRQGWVSLTSLRVP
jgi:2-alkyl-3-oxoalkanoate reductase